MAFGKDITNQRFGRLIAISDIGYDGKSRMWLCKCDCGREVTVPFRYLAHNIKKSCGCLRNDSTAKYWYKERWIPAFNRLYDSYIRSAKRRGYKFSLTKDQFKNIVTQNCHYCGREPSTVSKVRKISEFIYNGIDRLNNALGYTIRNCVPCCWKCNNCKGKLNTVDFINWIKQVYKHLTRK